MSEKKSAPFVLFILFFTSLVSRPRGPPRPAEIRLPGPRHSTAELFGSGNDGKGLAQPRLLPLPLRHPPRGASGRNRNPKRFILAPTHRHPGVLQRLRDAAPSNGVPRPRHRFSSSRRSPALSHLVCCSTFLGATFQP